MKRLMVGVAAGALALMLGIVVAAETADQANAFGGRGGGGRGFGGGGHARSMARPMARAHVRSHAGSRVNIRRANFTKHVSIRQPKINRHVGIRQPKINKHVNIATPNLGKHVNIASPNTRTHVHTGNMGPGGIKPGPGVVITTGPGVIKHGPGVIVTGPGYVPAGVVQQPVPIPGPAVVPGPIAPGPGIAPGPAAPRVYADKGMDPPKDPPPQKTNIPLIDDPWTTLGSSIIDVLNPKGAATPGGALNLVDVGTYIWSNWGKVNWQIAAGKYLDPRMQTLVNVGCKAMTPDPRLPDGKCAFDTLGVNSFIGLHITDVKGWPK